MTTHDKNSDAVYGFESIFRRLIPYQPRTFVPWHFFDIVFLVIIFYAVQVFVFHLLGQWQCGNLFPEPVADFTAQKINEQHFLVQLLMKGQGNPYVFWIAFVSGVIVIPIAEEFYFRLILQGYLEKKEKKVRLFFFHEFGIKILPGMFAITVPAIFFASLHYREPAKELHSLESLVKELVSIVFIYVISILLSLIYLKFIRKASFTDLGFDVKKIFSDIKTALGTGVIVIPALLLFFLFLQFLLPNIPSGQLDPVAVFLIAVVLGFLYFRTHRLLPAIILHIMLNGTSFFTC